MTTTFRTYVLTRAHLALAADPRMDLCSPAAAAPKADDDGAHLGPSENTFEETGRLEDPPRKVERAGGTRRRSARHHSALLEIEAAASGRSKFGGWPNSLVTDGAVLRRDDDAAPGTPSLRTFGENEPAEEAQEQCEDRDHCYQ
ncbi:hypothetical protein Ari01nite_69390 [Paractinoplanes rishiriensis]|uniref:Uncharacterized protein n=1 Tax=Paractinoplanes rishiriensis TaxID=1050105 RepID=A0A919MY58_9ACTN|nr:hypothetical protein Ari01nite_69390 [Actinoplanes rishiriensis]